MCVCENLIHNLKQTSKVIKNEGKNNSRIWAYLQATFGSILNKRLFNENFHLKPSAIYIFIFCAAQE